MVEYQGKMWEIVSMECGDCIIRNPNTGEEKRVAISKLQ